MRMCLQLDLVVLAVQCLYNDVGSQKFPNISKFQKCCRVCK